MDHTAQPCLACQIPAIPGCTSPQKRAKSSFPFGFFTNPLALPVPIYQRTQAHRVTNACTGSHPTYSGFQLHTFSSFQTGLRPLHPTHLGRTRTRAEDYRKSSPRVISKPEFWESVERGERDPWLGLFLMRGGGAVNLRPPSGSGLEIVHDRPQSFPSRNTIPLPL